MKLQHTTIALTATLVLLSGCANMSQEQQDTAKGAGIGAVGGAVLGGLIGGKSGAATGAAIGAVGGAVAGNIWSKKMQEKQAAMEQSTKGTGIDVSRTPDNQLKVNVPSDSGFAVGKADVQPQLRSVLDDATDPTAGVKNARKMISEDKADVLIAATATPVSMATWFMASFLPPASPPRARVRGVRASPDAA